MEHNRAKYELEPVFLLLVDLSFYSLFFLVLFLFIFFSKRAVGKGVSGLSGFGVGFAEVGMWIGGLRCELGFGLGFWIGFGF